ncbi:MAG: electron transporter RnfG, partial [Tissierellia bacterium]|nr:electron transporter RnfG [Tissierellia bacterium]
MKVVRYAIVLLIFGAVAGGVLAYSNDITAPIIAEQE